MNKNILLLSAFMFPFLLISQTQIGSDINGILVNDHAGWSVALSDDGLIVAVGMPNELQGGTCYVRVYNNIAGVWTQLGNDIAGETVEDQFGYSIALSADGSIIAVGATRSDSNGSATGHVGIFENIGGIWTQIGNDIDGELAGEQSGYSIGLSDDGTVVAIGSPYNTRPGTSRPGQARVYQNIGGIWTQIGGDFEGEKTFDVAGWAVGLSGNGNVVAIGSPENDNNENNAGKVEVFENIGGSWTQIGNDIYGADVGDKFGSSISLSTSGNIIAVGSPENREVGFSIGRVQVFENIAGNWSQIGSDLFGEASGDHFGRSVALSFDGSILAVGAMNNGNKGQAKIFKNIAGSWVQVGNDMDGDDSFDKFGQSIALSSDGSTVVVGAPYNSNNANDSGYARIFDMSGVLSISNAQGLADFKIYPNPVNDILNIHLKESLSIKKITLINNLGQTIKITKHRAFDVSTVASGVYVVKVETDLGAAMKKVIVNNTN